MLKQALRLPVNVKMGSDFKTLFQDDDFIAPIATANKKRYFNMKEYSQCYIATK